MSISDDALRAIVQYYTREAGVRNLEREIAKIARKTVTAIVSGKQKPLRLLQKPEEYLVLFGSGLAKLKPQIRLVLLQD